VNGRRGEDELAVLIKHSAELKRDLVDFDAGDIAQPGTTDMGGRYAK
jgi:hypothetical protein